MATYFTINNLKVNFKTFEGIKKVINLEHLNIAKGESFGLVGESGAGKSVLALAILKLLPVPPAIIESGQILFKGEDLLAKNEREMQKIRGREISMIFQDPMSTLNPVFTVGEQITRVLCKNGLSRRDAEKQALKMIDLVKLPDAANIMKKYPHELSGGQRQRIIIAIALSCGAEFLIADEPTRNLDVTIQAGILKLLAELRKELKVTVLFIANNLGLVSATCDRVGILHEGRIVETGTVREVIKNPVHPYTLTLLEAIPKTKGEKVAVNRLLAQHPDRSRALGCQYYDFCAVKDPLCAKEQPAMHPLTGNHLVACHRAAERGEKHERTAANG